MRDPTVFDGVHPGYWVHSTLFHHATAGDILGEVPCPDGRIAPTKQFPNGCGEGFAGIALILIIRMNHIPQFNGAILDFHVIEETNRFIFQADSPFKMILLMG